MNYLRNIKFFVQSVYKDYPKEFVLLIILLVIEAVLTSTSVLSIIPFADYLVDPKLNNPNVFTLYFLKILNIFNIQPSYLVFAIIFICSNLFRAGASLIIKYKFLNLRYEIEKSISKNTLQNIFQARWTFFNNLEYGSIFNSLTKEMAFIGSALRQIGEVFAGIFSLITYLAIPFFLDFKLSIFLLTMCFFIGSPFLILSKYSKRYGDMRTLEGNDYFGKLSEMFQSAKLILGYGKPKEELKNNFLLLDNYIKTNLKSQFINFVAIVLFKPLAIIILIVAFGLNFDFQSLPKYAAFFWSFYGALPIIAIILNSVIVINNLTPSHQQIQKIINRSKDHHEKSGNIKLDKQNFDINVQNLSFKYDGKKELFKDCSFKIFNNKINTIVGNSGVGKSTLIDLLISFQLPTSGSIFYGQNNLKDLDLKYLRQNIGYVPQDPFLFDTTIRENIKWAKKDANDNEIEQALKLANAFDFIMSLPQKLETQVGLRGLEISGGQRQRIALARALIRRPSILILDEATSSVDRLSANLIIEVLKKVSSKTTLIISTHDYNLLEISDKIILVKEKKVLSYQNLAEFKTESNFRIK